MILTIDVKTVSENNLPSGIGGKGTGLAARFRAAARHKAQHTIAARTIVLALGGDGRDVQACEIRRMAKHKRPTGPAIDEQLARQANLGALLLPCVVHLVRISSRDLDDDNLQGALKYFRDGVASALGVDDRDKRIRFTYAMERGAPKQYAVRVEIRGTNEAMSG